MSMNRIRAILKKQLKETLKNKSILLQFIMFPVLTVIIANSVVMENLPDNFFVNLFAVMYIGMSPLTSMSTIISEEKECNTLRVLLMSNVKASEYLLGTGFYIVALCMIGALVMGLQGDYSGEELFRFVVLMFTGIVVSTLIGAVVGVGSKNQMSATSISVPLMIIFSFAPMVAMFNDKIARISKYLYTQQISDMLTDISGTSTNGESWIIIGCNASVALVIFCVLYRKKGLDS